MYAGSRSFRGSTPGTAFARRRGPVRSNHATADLDRRTEDPAVEMFCVRCETSYATGTECPKDGARLIKMRAPTDPLVGRDLDGRFTMLEKLGDGGMGAVYRALQHSVDRQVAVKVIHPNLLANPDVIKRFLREARLASKLNHPNAVAILDFGQTEDGLFYLVMELLTGRTLEEVLLAEPVMDARRLVKLGKQICDALEAAHSLSIVHRDLKPANIMLLDTARDFVKVLDFGLAKSLAAEDVTGSSVSGDLNGTPAYVPPERAVGHAGDARSDLYSLGCILYLLGSGVLPFSARSAHELLIKHVVEPAPPMSGVPIALANVIDRLLLKDPGQRYQSAAETREALDAVFGEATRSAELPIAEPTVIVSDSTGALTRVAAPSSMKLAAVRRSRWPWVGAFATLLMLIALVIAIRGVNAIAASTPVTKHATNPAAVQPANTTMEPAPATIATPPPMPAATSPAASEAHPAKPVHRVTKPVEPRLPF